MKQWFPAINIAKILFFFTNEKESRMENQKGKLKSPSSSFIFDGRMMVLEPPL
jgi:hypothetical protein